MGTDVKKIATLGNSAISYAKKYNVSVSIAKKRLAAMKKKKLMSPNVSPIQNTAKRYIGKKLSPKSSNTSSVRSTAKPYLGKKLKSLQK